MSHPCVSTWRTTKAITAAGWLHWKELCARNVMQPTQQLLLHRIKGLLQALQLLCRVQQRHHKARIMSNT